MFEYNNSILTSVLRCFAVCLPASNNLQSTINFLSKALPFHACHVAIKNASMKYAHVDLLIVTTRYIFGLRFEKRTRKASVEQNSHEMYIPHSQNLENTESINYFSSVTVRSHCNMLSSFTH